MIIIGGGVLLALALASVLVSGASRKARVVTAALLFAGGLAATALYAWQGRPGMADQPFAERARELARREPADMSGAELLVRLQSLARERPDDAEPHYFIGELLKERGRDAEAIRAYGSALRRKPDYVPALMGLADAYVRLDGRQVSAQAARIYAQANRLDPSLVRAGFLSGMPAWLAGREAEAQAIWADVKARIPEDDLAAQGMYDALMMSLEAGEDDGG